MYSPSRLSHSLNDTYAATDAPTTDHQRHLWASQDRWVFIWCGAYATLICPLTIGQSKEPKACGPIAAPLDVLIKRTHVQISSLMKKQIECNFVLIDFKEILVGPKIQ